MFSVRIERLMSTLEDPDSVLGTLCPMTEPLEEYEKHDS